MKEIAFLLLILTVCLSCHKNTKEQTGQCDTYLIIGSTNTPGTSTIPAGIKTIINCYGPDLCYSFTGFEITEKAGNVFEIKARGKSPCGPAICLQAIYNVRDSITINSPKAGIYYLKFINNTTVFKTDTVLVN